MEKKDLKIMLILLILFGAWLILFGTYKVTQKLTCERSGTVLLADGSCADIDDMRYCQLEDGIYESHKLWWVNTTQTRDNNGR